MLETQLKFEHRNSDLKLEQNCLKNLSGHQCFWSFWISRRKLRSVHITIASFIGNFAKKSRNLFSFSGRRQSRAESVAAFVLICLLDRSENLNTKKPGEIQKLNMNLLTILKMGKIFKFMNWFSQLAMRIFHGKVSLQIGIYCVNELENRNLSPFFWQICVSRFIDCHSEKLFRVERKPNKLFFVQISCYANFYQNTKSFNYCSS